MKKNVCVICGEKFTEYPCNAMPIKLGKCCKECDETKVLPARIKMIQEQGKAHNN